MSDSNYRLIVQNVARYPVFLSIGPWADGYSGCISMGDESLALGTQTYLPPDGYVTLFFWRSGSCHGEQGWLALRAAYNPYTKADDGAWQQFWFDTDGGFEKHGKNASYSNNLTFLGRDGDTVIMNWSFDDAADWPAEWSRTPLVNPIEFAYTNQFDKVWDDGGSGAIFDCSIYKPKLDGYQALGYTTFGPGAEDPDGGPGIRTAIVARALEPGVLVPPNRYDWIGDDHHMGARGDCSWWTPVPPDGFVALGTAFVGYHGMPPVDAIACIRSDLAAPGQGGKMVYADRGSSGSHDLEIFQVVPRTLGAVSVGASLAYPNYILGSPPKFDGPVNTLKPPGGDDKPGALSSDDVQTIIQNWGPLLVLHPQEQYVPIAAEKFVAAATRKANGSDVYLEVTDQTILNGDISTAEAYVFANYLNENYTDLQFWFFYGYNGPTFVQVRCWLATGGDFLWSHNQDFDNLNCGQHQGDWENMTLRVDNKTKQVVALGYTSHGDTEWYAPGTGQPRSYSALHMHGSYPIPGEHLELAGWQEKDLTVAHLEVMVYSRNLCADGLTLDCSKRYRIVSSNFLPDITVPDWLQGDFANLSWGPPMHHEDVFRINDVPVIGSYSYDYEMDDEGPSTPVYRIA